MLLQILKALLQFMPVFATFYERHQNRGLGQSGPNLQLILVLYLVLAGISGGILLYLEDELSEKDKKISNLQGELKNCNREQVVVNLPGEDREGLARELNRLHKLLEEANRTANDQGLSISTLEHELEMCRQPRPKPKARSKEDINDFKQRLRQKRK